VIPQALKCCFTFSPDELQMLCYYANAVAKLADAQRVQSNGKPALT
jgi:hypothetical protein